MTGAELLARGTRELAQADIPDPGRDARRLLSHVLKVPPGRLTLFLPEPVEPDLTVIFLAMIQRRADRVPVSHLTGRRLFYGREFIVTKHVLDPRPETETLIEATLAEPFGHVLDLGTGTGAIALTLLSEVPDSTGVATDVSAAALEVAYWNRNAMKLQDRLDLRDGAWFAPIAKDDKFDLIVSNPPYIAAEEMADLSPEVRLYEPHLALTDGYDGLEAYRAIARDAPMHLVSGGRLLLEIGPTQAEAVLALLTKSGLVDCEVIRDLDGRDRVLRARAP